MRSISVLILVLAMATPSATFAQSRGGGGPQTAQQANGGAIGRLSPTEQLSRFQAEEQRRALALTPEEAEAEYGAERLELASRVAALIEQGKCREARALASEAGERQMALRIRQTCR